MSSTDMIRVLHVDDEPDFAEMAATFLEREDDSLSVETVTSVAEGLGYFHEADVDCIVSDYDMPGQNGIEFLKAVREEHPDLPFVLYTGKGSEEIASEAISTGVTEYLQKGSATSQYTVLANRIRNAVEQYRARREAEETQQRLREIAENVTDCVFLFDRDWQETVFISGYEDVWGRPREALEADPRDFLNSVHPDDREFVRESLGRVLDGQPTDIEYRILKDGETRWVRVKRQPIVDDDGAVVRIAGFTRDVTERKERERGLERYETIVEALGDPIYAIDSSGCFTFVNEAFVEKMGYGREEILGQHASTVLPEADVERGRDAIHELLSTDDKRTATREITSVTADGDRIPSENHLALLPPGEDGEFRGTAGVVRDITDRKETEEELRRHNESLEEFTGLVSHDLRNPLRVINGRVELAQERCESEHLAAIESAAGRMDRIIEDLLWLAREGRDIGSLESVVVEDVVADAWELIADDAEGATLQYADGTFESTIIKADVDRLAQLLENLLRNAVEHGGEDVTVTVGPLDEGFYVEDDGSGIDDEDREKIFSAGYSTQENGVGFGLSIVKQVADAHGWEVSVVERSSGGARFEISGVEFVR